MALASGRLPEDVREALSVNAAETVAAVRQCAEAQADCIPTSPQKPPLPKAPAPIENPLHCRSESTFIKTSTSYRAHSYHTKVPATAITPFVRAYTRPGETVFDPFCGSGMTGVAALMENRNALLVRSFAGRGSHRSQLHDPLRSGALNRPTKAWQQPSRRPWTSSIDQSVATASSNTRPGAMSTGAPDVLDGWSTGTQSNKSGGTDGDRVAAQS